MGIFANRTIKKDEELTFNYNVDRYGCVIPKVHVAVRSDARIVMKRNLATVASPTASAILVGRPRQISPLWMTCIWMVRMFIRGQIAWIADVVCVALGITDEVEMYGLKGSKKKKGKKLDEDFIVRLPSFLRGHPADIDLRVIPAGSQAHRSQGRAEGRVGDASDAKQEGPG